jgi:MFS family permease
MKKKILLSACLFHLLNDAATVTVPMILPILYSQQFIIKKYYQVGILSNLALFVTFFFQIFIAIISDKVEYRAMLLVSYLGICLCLVFLTLSSSFASLLLIFLTMRVFNSFYHPIGVAWVSKTHPSQGIDFAMGIQSGSGNLGVFIAFILSGYLAQHFNWKIPLLAWAASSFLLGSISFLLVRNISSREKDVVKLDFSSWMKTLKKIIIYIPGFAFGGACWTITIYYAPSLFHHKFLVPMGQTGLYLASWIGLGTVIPYFFGFLSRRFGRLKVSLFSVICATLFLFLLGSASLIAVAGVSLIFYGNFLFLIYPSFQSFVGSDVESRNQAAAFTLAANVQMLVGAAVALIAGFLSDKFGINSPFLFLGALGVATSIFYLFVKLSKNLKLRQRTS